MPGMSLSWSIDQADVVNTENKPFISSLSHNEIFIFLVNMVKYVKRDITIPKIWAAVVTVKKVWKADIK